METLRASEGRTHVLHFKNATLVTKGSPDRHSHMRNRQPRLVGVVLVQWCPSELGQMPGRDLVFQALIAVFLWLVVGGWSELPGREEGGN